jgi:hypothetical protein
MHPVKPDAGYELAFTTSSMFVQRVDWLGKVGALPVGVKLAPRCDLFRQCSLIVLLRT